MSEARGLDRSSLEAKKVDELRKIAKTAGISIPARASKSAVVDQLMSAGGSSQPSGGKMTDVSASSGATAPAAPAGGEGDDKPRRRPRLRAGEEVVNMRAPERVSQEAQKDASGDAAAVRLAAKAEREQSESSSGGSDSSGPEDSGSSDKSSDRPSDKDGSQQAQSGGREPRSRNRERNNRNREDRNFESFSNDNSSSRSSRRRRNRNRNRDERMAPQHTAEADAAFDGVPDPVSGVLELHDQGFGYIRVKNFSITANDVYVPVSQVRKYALRKGDFIEGESRPAANNEKFPALLNVAKINGQDPDIARDRPRFEDLTPLFPDQKLRLEVPGDKANMTARIVDLLSPIGKGQRGLIVSPPKAGKTTVMKQIAHSIEANNPEVHLMVLLIDERPEEVTDMRRTVRGEVIASTFDRPADEHTRVTEIALERAKRLVEAGQDVVIILDGITRLARAYNLAAPASGRIMSGGVDSGALYPPKRFFGAARNVEEGGSLTILATALVETGSKMDEVIFEEFKGTGNMELRLDRRLAERRLYPAIDANASSTRHEELLFDRAQLNQVWKLRRVLNALAQDGSTAAGLELLMDKIKSTASNDEFLAEIAKTPIPGT